MPWKGAIHPIIPAYCFSDLDKLLAKHGKSVSVPPWYGLSCRYDSSVPQRFQAPIQL
jgi:hypothetical protein